jgi:Na+-transporting methylmalonyl-CoA/oxaloacetate decarboxylase gamma subunit
VEALAIGVVFSVLLALAVFVVARGARGDEFAASPSAPAEIRAPAPTA